MDGFPDVISALYSSLSRCAGYALPTTDVNHWCISGYERHECCWGRLAQWQCAAPAVPARAGWVAVPARHARVAQFGVRQPCCRASRARDHTKLAAVTPQLCAQWDHVSGSIPLPTTMTRGATFSVRQPCCRASRARDSARGIPFPILVTRLLNVLVPISESVRHACDPCP